MAKQFTIIDGYNVLHVNGYIDSRKVGPGTLEKARNLLLGLLVKHMDVDDRRRTIVVFDSSEPNLPGRMTVNEVMVEFANQHDSADELIGLLIARHSAPRQLTVVSSDHQVQRSATVRGATAVDADDWIDQFQSRRPQSEKSKDESESSEANEKQLSGDMASAAYWKDEFAIDDWTLEVEPADSVPGRRRVAKPNPANSTNASESIADGTGKARDADKTTGSKSDDLAADASGEIFPPGYMDDLADDLFDQ